jgi:Meckel syndrome type 1 protein
MASPKIPLLETVRTDLDRRLFDAVRTGLEVDPAKRTLTAAAMRDLLVGLVDMGTERTRLAAMLEPVRTSAARAKLPSKPGIPPGKPAPPRPVAKSIPPAQASPARRPEPDPFKVPMLSLPAPAGSPPSPLPPRPPAPPAAMKTTLLGVAPPVAAPAPAVAPAPAPSLSPAAPAIASAIASAPAPAETPEPAPAPPPIVQPPSPPEPHAPMSTADALAFEPVAVRRRSMLPIAASVGAVIAVAVVAVVVLGRSSAPSPASAAVASAPAASRPPEPVVPGTPPAATSAPAPSVAPTALATAATPVASESSAPALSESASAQTPPDQGQLVFPASAAGHRIFVDGRVVGDGAQPAVVRCGPHDVKVGSAGTPQRVDVPCGGSLTLTH